MYKQIKKFRSQLLVYLTHKMALPILKLIRKPIVFPYSPNELKNFPQQSLGNDLIIFLEKKQLQLLPYYAKHDIKHILLDYDTTDEGEACLQCFMLGNGHISFPVLATVVYGFVTMPDYWKSFTKAYHTGKKCSLIANWKWFEILHQPTHLLKQKIKLHEKNTL
jgi:Coenzyme Q (ubiquinone) biosynthesis protein Coq4